MTYFEVKNGKGQDRHRLQIQHVNYFQTCIVRKNCFPADKEIAIHDFLPFRKR